ncbi:50S ribosomal protein L24 [soil metagenome]
MMKIKKGDEIVVIRGKDKGRRGKVLNVIVEDERVLVEGANLKKKHVKSNPNQNQEGGVVQQEASIHLSNVMIYNPSIQRHDKVGFRTLEDGKKVRYFKSNNELIDV